MTTSGAYLLAFQRLNELLEASMLQTHAGGNHWPTTFSFVQRTSCLLLLLYRACRHSMLTRKNPVSLTSQLRSNVLRSCDVACYGCSSSCSASTVFDIACLNTETRQQQCFSLIRSVAWAWPFYFGTAQRSATTKTTTVSLLRVVSGSVCCPHPSPRLPLHLATLGVLGNCKDCHGFSRNSQTPGFLSQQPKLTVYCLYTAELPVCWPGL